MSDFQSGSPFLDRVKAEDIPMEEYRFNCSREMAQKFWAVCRAREETPGSALRRFILKRVQEHEEINGKLTAEHLSQD